MVPRIATGVTTMTPASWTRKQLALIAAVVFFASGAACLALASPVTFPSPTLGAEWQCRSIAGIFTTCTRVRDAEPALQSSRHEPLCVRRSGQRA
jgi:hypothetical protein